MGYYIIIRGPLGIGKSTIAKSLAKNINAEYIPIDRILDKYNLTKYWEKGYISQKSFLKANEIIISKVNKIIKKKPIVFDGNFYWESQIKDLVSKLNYPHYIFTLKAPLKTCIERDIKRKKTHGKDAVKAVYKKSTGFKYGIIINTNNKTIKQIVGYILKKISGR